MKAYLEPIAFVLRICTDEAASVPMPWHYVGAATVTLDDNRVATLKGLVAPSFTRDTIAAVIEAFGRVGVTEAIWSRKKGGLFVPVRLKVPGPGQPLYL